MQYQCFCHAITLIIILSYSRYWLYYPFILLEERIIIVVWLLFLFFGTLTELTKINTTHL